MKGLSRTTVRRACKLPSSQKRSFFSLLPSRIRLPYYANYHTLRPHFIYLLRSFFLYIFSLFSLFFPPANPPPLSAIFGAFFSLKWRGVVTNCVTLPRNVILPQIYRFLRACASVCESINFLAPSPSFMI